MIRDRTVPRLAEGTELLGPYRGSGFRQVPYLIRTGKGHVVQVTHLLFVLAAHIDGRRNTAALAHRMSEELGRPVSAGNVDYLLTRKLEPLGIVSGATAFSPFTAGAPEVLPFRRRRAVVPAGVVSVLARVFQPLFWPPIVVVVLAALAAFDIWLVLHHGIATGVRQLLVEPLAFLAVAFLVVASGAFHELGHASACRYGGAQPGRLGVGLYVAWPVFYSDVTDAYRLGRGGRLRTDLGGVYFNAVFGLAATAAFLVTGIEALTVFVVIQQLQIAHQFMPFVRLDGYYVIADLAGVPEPFTRLKPVLASLVPRRPPSPEAVELTPWARAVIAAWGLSAVPLVAANVALLVLHGPTVLGLLWSALPHTARVAITALAHGEVVDAVSAGIRTGILLIPVVGLLVLLARVAKVVGSALCRSVQFLPQRYRARAGGPGSARVTVVPDLLEISAGTGPPVLYRTWFRSGPPPGAG